MILATYTASVVMQKRGLPVHGKLSCKFHTNLDDDGFAWFGVFVLGLYADFST